MVKIKVSLKLKSKHKSKLGMNKATRMIINSTFILYICTRVIVKSIHNLGALM